MFYDSVPAIEPLSNCRPAFTVHVLYPSDMMQYEAVTSLFNLLALRLQDMIGWERGEPKQLIQSFERALFPRSQRI